MELVDKKVYRLDVGDFYSVVEQRGSNPVVYGFSQSLDFLLRDTVDYARRFNHGSARVFVYRLHGNGRVERCF